MLAHGRMAAVYLVYHILGRHVTNPKVYIFYKKFLLWFIQGLPEKTNPAEKREI